MGKRALNGRKANMTIQELINRLEESGDQKWRNFAEVRITDPYGRVLADGIDLFDVKEGVKSIDIRIPY